MDKIKIGIMTFYAARNNGAALQGFALQQKLKYLGANVELIRFYDQHNEKTIVKHSRLYNLVHNPQNLINIILHFRRIMKTRGVSALTDRAFQDFQKNWLKTSIEPYYKYDDLKEANSRYNSFVTGSDMVWTPIGQNLEAYFLQFADKGKRFSFSPSLTGVDNFTDEQHNIIQKYLMEMDFISCRENEGVEYVKKNTNRDSVQTIDPTLLFSKNEWCNELNIALSSKKQPYILCYMFDGLSKVHKNEIKRIAKMKQCSIRYIPMNREQSECEIDNGYRCGYGPKEFVELFMNASFIVTNTYHGLLFSLISENPFVLVHREKKNKWKSNEGRMSYILDLINCSDRYIDQDQNIPDDLFKIDYSKINPIISIERDKSVSYLKKIIDESKKCQLSTSEKFIHIGIMPKNKCTGCGLCSNICPFDAIKMKLDDEGFISPIINEERCRKCGKCVNECPSLNHIETNEPIDAFGCISKDLMLKNSSSGGAFLTLARYVIEVMHGYVFGAVFDKDMTCLHIEATTMEEVKSMQGSKYVQSNICGTYKRIKELIEAGNIVLFSGTPCQIAGITKYIGYKSENLITIDLICHGVPSVGFWKKYLFNSFPSKVSSYFFRNRNNREKGQTSFEIKVSYDSGEKIIPWSKDIYYKTFLSGLSFREACYYCKYARPLRVSDITIGDFDSEKKYPKFYPNSSKSVIIINTQRGKWLLNQIESKINMLQIDYYTEVNHNTQLRIPSTRPSQRSVFYQDLNRMSWKKFINKYL